MKPFSSMRPILAVVGMIAFTAVIVSYSLTASLNIPTFHLDGAFQTASGLHRIYMNEVPGRDFFPYLGPGLIYLIYPLFLVSGATVSSSVFAANIMVLLAAHIGATTIFQIIFEPSRLYISVLFGAAFVAGGLAFLYLYSIFNLPGQDLVSLIKSHLTPGNSLRPLRAFAPYLAALIVWFSVKNLNSPKRLSAIFGIISGLALLWSNDYAILTAGMVFLFGIAVIAIHKQNFLSSFTILLFFTLFSAFLFLYLGTRGHILELFRYNFLDVRVDQWWYFSPYTDNNRVFSAGDVVKLTEHIALPAVFLLLTSLIAVKRRSLSFSTATCIGVVLILGGAISSIGGHIDPGYFNASKIWLLLIAIVMSMTWLKNRMSAETIESVLIAAFAVSILVTALFAGQKYFSAKALADADPNRLYVKELGGFLPIGYSDYVTLARESKDVSVLEEYWGIWSAIQGRHPSWPVDSVIHALGSIRKVASEELTHHDGVVVTTRLNTSREWQPWNLSQNWWFYGPLLESYFPTYVSPSTVVWEKVEKRAFEEVSCKKAVGSNSSIVVQSTQPGYYEVTLNYSGSGLHRRELNLVYNGINFAKGADGYLSLNPRATVATFPVHSCRAGGVNLDLVTVPGNDLSLTVDNCSARRVTFRHPEVLPKNGRCPD